MAMLITMTMMIMLNIAEGEKEKLLKYKLEGK